MDQTLAQIIDAFYQSLAQIATLKQQVAAAEAEIAALKEAAAPPSSTE